MILFLLEKTTSDSIGTDEDKDDEDNEGNDSINTCQIFNGGCDQICVPEGGSRYCQCRNGYNIDPDGKSCRGMFFTIVY